MFDSILGSLFGNKTETKKSVSSSVLNRIKKRKLIIQKFKSINPNDNLKRAKTAKELLNVLKTEGERKAARKFYKDETELNNLKNKIKDADSINEKLSLARQGKRLATKQQRGFWENIINKLQKRKQDRDSAIASKKETLVVTDTNKEQDKKEDKDMKEVEEKQEQNAEKSESDKSFDNDIEEPEEGSENEEEVEEVEEEEDEDQEEENDDYDYTKEDEDKSGNTLNNDIDNKNESQNLT